MSIFIILWTHTYDKMPSNEYKKRTIKIWQIIFLLLVSLTPLFGILFSFLLLLVLIVDGEPIKIDFKINLQKYKLFRLLTKEI